MLHTKLKCGAHDAKINRSKYTQSPTRSHVLGGGGTGDNLDQLTGNGSLSGTVVQNLESVDHVTGVLGGVVHGVAASRLLTGVTLGKSLIHVSKSFFCDMSRSEVAYPVKGVGQGVFTEVTED